MRTRPSRPPPRPGLQGPTANNYTVAVKVRRPGVVDQVALDCYAVRLLLAWLQDFWGGTRTIRIVDEVTAG